MNQIIKQENGDQLLSNIREKLLSTRHTAYNAVNFAMVTAYWNIGKLIVEDEQTRQWYMNEAAEQAWSSRQLDRQISVLYYERLLNSADKDSVRSEAIDKLSTLTPYV